MPRVGDDPVARRRRGGRMIDRRERPSSIVRPEPNFSKMESAWAANRRRQRVALTDRASMDKDERQRGSVWLLTPFFQCRLLATTPYLAARRHHRRRRRGGRSSNNNHSNNNNIIIISVRRERPSSSVRPQPDSSTAQPSTSPSCGQQPLHRPGGSSRSSSIAGRPFPFWGGLFGTCLWVPPIVAIDGGQQPQRRPRRERVGPIAGRSERGSVC